MEEPTLPLSQFCAAMNAWAEACMTSLPDDDDERLQWRRQFKRHWQFISLAIRKSNLLYRILCAGEEIRTQPCPKHRGHWSGCSLDLLTAEGMIRGPRICECQHEDNITGWLPNAAK